VKERPILFSAPMVRALLAGTKTQTRRVVKGDIVSHSDGSKRRVFMDRDIAEVNALLKERQDSPLKRVACPYGQGKDRLWVKETWRTGTRLDAMSPSQIEQKCRDAGYDKGACCPVRYLADGHTTQWGDRDTDDFGHFGKTRVSIHMPRWASRLTLEIVSVRVERLNDISEADAIAEGVTAVSSGGVTLFTTTGVNCFQTAKDAYAALWESINGPGSWDANPWVWAVEFRRSDGNGESGDAV